MTPASSKPIRHLPPALVTLAALASALTLTLAEPGEHAAASFVPPAEAAAGAAATEAVPATGGCDGRLV